jgi:basic amino acid/polyamine antiporter, APA family
MSTSNEDLSLSNLEQDAGFVRELGVFDSTMIVIGAMIGSGIFLVPAEMGRNIGSPGWLLVAWAFAAVVTVAAALSYGELAAMMPKAGGMYVYLREAFSPLVGFLYGWTLFAVIQTGTIAAVAVGFARFTGVLFPQISEDAYIVSPIHIGGSYAISLSTGQLLALVVILVLAWTNSQGVRYAKILQNVFTSAKTLSLAALVVMGLIFWNRTAVETNLANFWTPHNVTPITSTLSALSGFGLFAALCISQSGSLFSSDAWHGITFAAGEVKDPAKTLPRALALGTISVMALYILANIAYLLVLPFEAIQHAKADRVATAMMQMIFPGWGVGLMAVAIMVSTFGCINALTLAGPRAYFSMARDGLFPEKIGVLNRARVPGTSIWIQGIWAAILLLPRTFDPSTNTYGNLYGNLLEYVISAELIFYILTISAVIRLRWKRPDANRPYRAWGYPLMPAIYIVGCTIVLVCLFAFRPATTWPGVLIVLLGLPVYYLFATNARKQLLTNRRE